MKKLFLLLVPVLIVSCTRLEIFERTIFFPRHEWPSQQHPSFNFTIEDTAARYNIFVVIRHSDAYNYNNLWLNVTTIPPEDTAQTIKAKLVLGDNMQWLGTAMDDIIEHRIRINTYPVKFKKGNYTFQLEQIMREDPLKNILNAGVRVEKAS